MTITFTKHSAVGSTEAFLRSIYHSIKRSTAPRGIDWGGDFEDLSGCLAIKIDPSLSPSAAKRIAARRG